MRFPSLIPPRAMNVLELWGKELTDNYFNTLQKTIGGNTGATAHEWQTVLGRCDPGLLAAEGASLTPLLFCTKVIPTILLCFVTCQAHWGRQTPVSDRIIVNNIYDLITDICWQSFIMSRSGSGLAGTEGSTNSIRWDLQCWNIFHDLNISRSESTLEPDAGPDRLLPAESYTSSSPGVPVKLWMPPDDEDCDDEDLR